MFGAREQATHHGLDLRARKRDGVCLGQRLVCKAFGQSLDRANQRTTKVIVGTVRAFLEAAGPSRVIWIALARAEVPFDLVFDGGLGLGHLDTSIIRIEIQSPGPDHFQDPCDFRTGRVREPRTADEFTLAIQTSTHSLVFTSMEPRRPKSGRLKQHHTEAPDNFQNQRPDHPLSP